MTFISWASVQCTMSCTERDTWTAKESEIEEPAGAPIRSVSWLQEGENREMNFYKSTVPDSQDCIYTFQNVSRLTEAHRETPDSILSAAVTICMVISGCPPQILTLLSQLHVCNCSFIFKSVLLHMSTLSGS